MNYAAIDRGIADVKKVKVPAEWAKATDSKEVVKAQGERTKSSLTLSIIS